MLTSSRRGPQEGAGCSGCRGRGSSGRWEERGGRGRGEGGRGKGSGGGGRCEGGCGTRCDRAVMNAGLHSSSVRSRCTLQVSALARSRAVLARFALASLWQWRTWMACKLLG
eukprot:2278105-Rhodomonas_salina.4